MSRLYSISFNNVAITVAQDLINVTATASMAFAIHSIELGQKTLTAWEAKEIRLRRMPATVTAGSGGSTPTPQKLNNGDAAATVTSHANDTTGMTTSGTASDIFARDWEFLNGFFWMPAPEQRPIIAPSQGVSLVLGTAPSASMTCSGTMIVEELF